MEQDSGRYGFVSHHNVAVGSATYACHSDTQNYGDEGFAGISGGWQPTKLDEVDVTALAGGARWAI